MQIARLFSRRVAVIAGGIIAVMFVGWLFAYEPVTRNVLATDDICIYCHLKKEYDPAARLSFTKSHPLELEEGEVQTTCVDCHLPEGFWYATFAYTHYVSATDLFGHFRDREGERSGEWIPLSAARAYRVRDRYLEYDSNPCRVCHIEEEIEPTRDRGKKAHEDALETKETCMACHTNLVHRYVDLREIDEEESDDEDSDDLDDDDLDDDDDDLDL